MKLAFRLVLLAALAVLGVWLWSVLFPSPQNAIRKRLAEVARAASPVPNEGPLARAVNVQKLAGFFGPAIDVTINLPGRARHTLASREEIAQAALAARAAGTMKVEILDPKIALAPDKQSADVNLTVKAIVPGERDFLVQEMKVTLKKIDGEWLIIRVETVRTLTRAHPLNGAERPAA